MSEAAKTHLGLGSNLGNRQRNIERAVEMLSAQATVECVSKLYETPSMYDGRQPSFLNAVAICTTALTPRELLRFVQGIEECMGRVPGPKNAPRPLDIDILFYGGLVIDEQGLTIPHVAMEERPFVLVPLAELDPAVANPATGKTASQMLAEVSGVAAVVPYDAETAYWAGLKRGKQAIPLEDPSGGQEWPDRA